MDKSPLTTIVAAQRHRAHVTLTVTGAVVAMVLIAISAMIASAALFAAGLIVAVMVLAGGAMWCRRRGCPRR